MNVADIGRVLFCTVLLALAPGLAEADSPIAVLVDGEPFPAQLAAVDAEWQLQFDAPRQRRTLTAAELVRWGSYAETPQGPIVVMSDGGLLAAAVTRLDGEGLRATSVLLGELKLPLESVAGVVFLPPAGRRQTDQLLDRLARAAGKSDRLLLHNGDEITGRFDAIDEETVTVEADVEPLKIRIDRIAALVFNPDLKRAGESRGRRAWAGFSDGSRLIVTRLLLDTRSVQLTTTAGQTCNALPKKLVCLQPLGGRVTYLSDLKPAGYRYVPFLSRRNPAGELRWPYRDDRNVDGGRLRCGGRLYLKGLGMHSYGRLTYLLGDQPYHRFQAELGIDDSTSGGGSVRFRVYVDGRKKYPVDADDTPIRGGDAPVSISVDLTGAKQLDLVVDFADRADELDHADWLDARLAK